MREPYINSEVRSSFRCSDRNFVSRSAGGFISCPPYVIASVASRRLTPDTQLEMPEGYNEDTLGNIRGITGWVNQDVSISFRQAAELALIGFQLQDMDTEDKVQPPLRHYEKQSIGHLIREVCALNFDGMSDPGVSEHDLAYIAMTQRALAGPQK